MRRALLILFLVLLPSTAFAALDPAEYDRKIEAELQAVDPAAAKTLHDANAIRTQDSARASALYAEVIAKVPTFDHAYRRRCYAEIELQHDGEGIALCRAAVAARRSAENVAALAFALAGRDPRRVSAAERTEALTLVDEARRAAPNESAVLDLCAQTALAASDLERLRAITAQLEIIAPNDVQTLMFAALLAAADGRFDDVDAKIERLRAVGAPAELVSRLTAMREQVQSDAQPWRRPVLWLARITGAWAVGLLLIALFGFAVSRATLRALSARPDAAASPEIARLRGFYRALVWIAAAYYYLSLPLVAVFVLGALAAIVLLCLAVGVIPVKLLVIAGVLSLATVWATLKSVFVRIKEKPIGEAIPPGTHARLQELLAQVAATVGTRPVDEVRLTIGTELAVMERAGTFRDVRGRGTRTLILGVGLLDGLRIRELKALLAHEMGHFKNEDTAGGGLALAVRRAILLMALQLAQSGAAVPWNPAWWFVRGYHALFLRLSQGASRMQEVLADRWAIAAYGARAFSRGLEHAIQRTAFFETHVDRTVADVQEQQLGLANLYTFRPSVPVSAEEIEEKARESIEAKPSVYDSHPSPAERLAAAAALASEGEPAAPEDEEDAWSLFDDRESLEVTMTERLRALLSERGIELAAAS